jgi:hypothetical protein
MGARPTISPIVSSNDGGAMAHRPIPAQRLVALFVLGWLLFSFPLLSLFNRGGAVFGIPLLYAYLFGVWIGLIILMILAVERSS